MTFHPEASHEFHEAALYYERQQPGLGEKFTAAVESGFRQIQRSPFTWRQIRGDIRRFLVKTFPYGLVYAAIDDEIFVLAVMHLSASPTIGLAALTFYHRHRKKSPEALPR